MHEMLKGITGKDLKQKNNFAAFNTVYNMLIGVNIYG